MNPVPESSIENTTEREEVYTWSLRTRIEHFLIFSSVLVLVATGFPLKFHDASWAQAMSQWFGGAMVASQAHRIAGIILTCTCLVHVSLVIYRLMVGKRSGFRLTYLEMLPDRKDLDDLIDDFKYYLFLTDTAPQKRRYNYASKLEYLSLYWGCPLVILTGLVMWFKEWTYSLEIFSIAMPAWLINVCRIAHGMEALLAFSTIVVVHWYMVHWNPDIFPARWTWVTGTVPRELMEKEHPIEFQRLNGDSNRTAPQDSHE
jgi:Ni,Fe-hydrogenase I cytochrome b subunit